MLHAGGNLMPIGGTLTPPVNLLRFSEVLFASSEQGHFGATILPDFFPQQIFEKGNATKTVLVLQ